MEIRPYRSDDCPALAELFFHTVRTVNRQDYTQAEVEAWADGCVDTARWNAAFLASRTLVAVANGEIAGFANIHPSGYLDMLYVHRDFQHQGIATALCSALEADFSHVTTHASRTAKPFFLQRGYRLLRSQQVKRHGVWLENFIMELQR